MNDNRSSEFISRHIGPSASEETKMLKAVGYSSMDQFIKDIVPSSILEEEQLDVRDSV